MLRACRSIDDRRDLKNLSLGSLTYLQHRRIAPHRQPHPRSPPSPPPTPQQPVQETGASRHWLHGPLRECARTPGDDGALARSLLDAGATTDAVDRVRKRAPRVYICIHPYRSYPLRSLTSRLWDGVPVGWLEGHTFFERTRRECGRGLVCAWRPGAGERASPLAAWPHLRTPDPGVYGIFYILRFR